MLKGIDTNVEKMLNYLQLPEEQSQDMKNMSYLENQSFKIEDEFGYSDNIILQVGNRQYNTEPNSSKSV